MDRAGRGAVEGTDVKRFHEAQVGLELGKDAEHVEERLAGSGRGVHGLFGGSEMGALVLECGDDDLEITHRARQAVDARDHQRLAGMDEF